ncbi:unnamed protein product [Diabrotica balteata]|uniref:Protein grindelwald n=1 Tax=Diabrotica balteata TaxID=107213 RepID=A0A9N9T5K8_DIABA|nr:unnamed protein product [Diabrotica balteata]
MLWKIVFFVSFCASAANSQGLTVTGVKCGERTCKLLEYCSDFDGICEPCVDICNSSHHNFNQNLCEKKCQNYLHDIRYVISTSAGSGNEDIRETVNKLSKMVTVNLTLVCLMLIVLAGFLCFQFYRWKEKKNITFASLKDKILGKKNTQESPSRTNNIQDPSSKKSGDLRLDITSNASHSDHSPVTLSTSISRRPAEDCALDYAYDNHAMTPSSR